MKTEHCFEQKRTGRPHSGFTLVELLVTIAVLAVLAALLFPALTRVIESGKSASCMNNMRTYGTAVLTFIADNGGMLPDRSAGSPNPPALRYGQWVQPYLGIPLKDLRCPLATSAERKLDSGFTYNANGALTEYFHTLKGIPAPSARIVLAAEMYDWTQGFWVSGHFNRTIWGNGNGGVAPEDEGKVRRPQYHTSKGMRGLHLFFLDGHVELVGAPPNNNWDKSPTLGDKSNGGYFYTTGQFASLKNGSLIVK